MQHTYINTYVYFLFFLIKRYSDKVHITSGASNGQDIWGMEEFQFLPYYCGRSIKTFTKGPTAFIANKDGPVRALRSWVGANSGMLTQRDLKLYEQKQEQTTYFKVHSIPGGMFYINFDVRNTYSYYFYSPSK